MNWTFFTYAYVDKNNLLLFLQLLLLFFYILCSSTRISYHKLIPELVHLLNYIQLSLKTNQSYEKKNGKIHVSSAYKVCLIQIQHFSILLFGLNLHL